MAFKTYREFICGEGQDPLECGCPSHLCMSVDLRLLLMTPQVQGHSFICVTT
jgi:hypothetical protein